MALKAIYDDLDDIPEEYKSLYSERDGQHELTGITGVRPQSDVDRINEANRKEKADHKVTKGKLAVWTAIGQSSDDVIIMIDKQPELEAAASGNLDEEKIEKIVEGRVKTRITPLERENTTLKISNEELVGENMKFKGKEKSRIVKDAVRVVASEMKILPTAIEDAMMYGQMQLEVLEDGTVVTKEMTGKTQGLAVQDWLAEMRDTREHWWAPSIGGGAGGSTGGTGYAGNNPWSEDHWSLTEQGKIVKEKGSAYAEKLANAVGCVVGSTGPVAKKKS